MNKDRCAGFLSAINCVNIEAEQWTRLARETKDTRAQAVMIAVAEALVDTAKRMTGSLTRAMSENPSATVEQ